MVNSTTMRSADMCCPLYAGSGCLTQPKTGAMSLHPRGPRVQQSRSSSQLELGADLRDLGGSGCPLSHTLTGWASPNMGVSNWRKTDPWSGSCSFRRRGPPRGEKASAELLEIRGEGKHPINKGMHSLRDLRSTRPALGPNGQCVSQSHCPSRWCPP